MVGKFIILLVSAILIQGCTTSRSRKSSQAKKLRAPKATVAKAGTKDEKAIEPKEVPLPLTATYIQAEGHTNSPLKGDNLALF
jgi:hypothetical protein